MRHALRPGFAVLLVLTATGCSDDPAERKARAERIRGQFRDALENHYFELNRQLASERSLDGVPLSHEYLIDTGKYPETKYPEKDDAGMPAAKRKLLYPGREEPESAVPDAYEGVVHYLVVTYRRQEESLKIPSTPVDRSVSLDLIESTSVEEVQAVYVPIVYRRGKHHFVYWKGRLTPDEVPEEEPLTEEERSLIIRPPPAKAGP